MKRDTVVRVKVMQNPIIASGVHASPREKLWTNTDEHRRTLTNIDEFVKRLPRDETVWDSRKTITTSTITII
ncbi:hypothetical protein M758_8G184100 [Ceratodon purpureus]|nr:hypothetical protein M758_8G184100 [Ceratodon purpureus]